MKNQLFGQLLKYNELCGYNQTSITFDNLYLSVNLQYLQYIITDHIAFTIYYASLKCMPANEKESR